MAIVSILHRITGVILFLSIPVLLYILHASLISQQTFTDLQSLLTHSTVKIIVMGVLASAIYHLFAGIRHLIMDCGVGESKRGGRITAWVMILVTLAVVAFLGGWLW